MPGCFSSYKPSSVGRSVGGGFTWRNAFASTAACLQHRYTQILFGTCFSKQGLPFEMLVFGGCYDNLGWKIGYVLYIVLWWIWWQGSQVFSCSPNLLIFLLRDLSLFKVFHFFDWQTHLDHQHCWFELEAHLHVGTAAIPTSALAQLWIRSNSWFNRWFRRSSSSIAMPGCQLRSLERLARLARLRQRTSVHVYEYIISIDLIMP